MYRLILLLSVIALVSGETTQIVRCINHAGDLPLNTYVEGCTTPPCLLPQLQDAVIHIVFKAPRILQSMQTLATAYLSIGIINMPIPYPLGDNAVTCNFLTNTYCPVLTGEVVQYTLKMFIEPTFPVGTSVTLEFRVVDERNQPLLCIRFGLRVEPPVQTRGITNSTLFIDNEN